MIEEFEIESSPGLTKLLSDEPLEEDEEQQQQQQSEGDEKDLSRKGTQDGTGDQNTCNNDTTQQVDHHVPGMCQI